MAGQHEQHNGVAPMSCLETMWLPTVGTECWAREAFGLPSQRIFLCIAVGSRASIPKPGAETPPSKFLTAWATVYGNQSKNWHRMGNILDWGGCLHDFPSASQTDTCQNICDSFRAGPDMTHSLDNL